MHTILTPNKHILRHTTFASKEAMLRYAYITLLVIINLEFKERITKGYATSYQTSKF